uniref:Hexosyltransferase n=1 Tax=Schistocephalus solidus TaxID=70667 RepID=A0A0X3PNV9_SCHSO
MPSCSNVGLLGFNRHWRKVALITALTLAAWTYLTYLSINKSVYVDSEWTLAAKSGGHLETQADFDGTASSCRCWDVRRRNRTRFWPPLDTRDLFCAQDGTYDVTLCVDQLTSRRPYRQNKLTQRLRVLKSQNPDAKVTGSELNQWYQLEDSSLRQQYDMYPMAINISETIKNISLGLPVTEAPITNPNIKLLRVSQSICPPTDSSTKSHHDLVVVYKSAIYNFEDRQKLRSEYSQLKEVTKNRIAIVFSVGMPRSTGENIFHMNGFSIKLPERAGAVLRDWSGRRQEALQRVHEEADLYDDLILGDYEDTYVNLTYKMITNYRWASAFCRGKTDAFLFLDDDYRFSPSNVLKYLDTLEPRAKAHLLAGPLMNWRRVIRPFKDPSRNKWAVTTDEVPWPDFPPYFWGVSYFVGIDVISDLVVATAYTRFLWVDDSFLGFAIAKLPYTFDSMKGFYMEFANHKKALVSHEPITFTLKMIIDNLHQLKNALHL